VSDGDRHRFGFRLPGGADLLERDDVDTAGSVSEEIH
jgi:hypothetical protein